MCPVVGVQFCKHNTISGLKKPHRSQPWADTQMIYPRILAVLSLETWRYSHRTCECLSIFLYVGKHNARCTLLLWQCSESLVCTWPWPCMCSSTSVSEWFFNSRWSSCIFPGSAEIIAIAKGTTHDPAGIKSVRLEVSSVNNSSRETTGKGRWGPASRSVWPPDTWYIIAIVNKAF